MVGVRCLIEQFDRHFAFERPAKTIIVLSPLQMHVHGNVGPSTHVVTGRKDCKAHLIASVVRVKRRPKPLSPLYPQLFELLESVDARRSARFVKHAIDLTDFSLHLLQSFHGLGVEEAISGGEPGAGARKERDVQDSEVERISP